jgi:hypothetical protein
MASIRVRFTNDMTVARQYIEDNAHGFFSGNFFICPRVTFNEVEPAILATETLLSSNEPVFYH